MAQTMGNGNLLNNLEKTKIKSFEKVCHILTWKSGGRGEDYGRNHLKKNKNNNKPPPEWRFYPLGTKMHNHI